MKPNLPRWLSFVFVFTLFTVLWVILAAATSPHARADSPTPMPAASLLEPGHPIFGLIIGAIVLVTIIVSSVIFRKRDP